MTHSATARPGRIVTRPISQRTNGNYEEKIIQMTLRSVARGSRIAPITYGWTLALSIKKHFATKYCAYCYFE